MTVGTFTVSHTTGKGIQPELLLDNGSEAVDGTAHIGVAAGKVDRADGGKVEEAHGLSLHAAASFWMSGTGVSSVSSNWNGPQETMSLSRGSGAGTRTETNSAGRGTGDNGAFCAMGAGVLTPDD